MGRAAVARAHADGFEFLGPHHSHASVLGKPWVPMYSTPQGQPVPFEACHFEKAMTHLIREPNINSTAILRADILRERTSCSLGGPLHEVTDTTQSPVDSLPDDPDAKLINIHDVDVRAVALDPHLQLVVDHEYVRRMVPRNPYKDALINQTCLVLKSNGQQQPNRDTTLVVYTPHLANGDSCPFYIPHVKSVAILLHNNTLSVHYIPFDHNEDAGCSAAAAAADTAATIPHSQQLHDEKQRVVRTAYRLLQTAFKHSNGVMQGYEKKVNHDQVVDKVKFQDTYTSLKKKYSKFLVENWAESTDPKKHVFEDIGIAAFLIQLWTKLYGADFKSNMQFRDLGCGNGALVFILISEGVNGIGIDARLRKSWAIYPQNVRACLKEQVIVPAILLRPHPEVRKRMPALQHNGAMFPMKLSHEYIAPATLVYSSEDLLKSPQVNIAEYPRDTFIIGNHSDELTCWIPLLGYPFMVIPCCSHNLAGQRVRYNNTRRSAKLKNSTYAGLVDHVENIASQVGWKVQKEMLRIPSTRNAAIIGYENPHSGQFPTEAVYRTLAEEGGADGWIQNTMALTKRNPRGH